MYQKTRWTVAVAGLTLTYRKLIRNFFDVKLCNIPYNTISFIQITEKLLKREKL